MKLKLSRIISHIFHPLLIPVYSLLLYYTIGVMQIQPTKVLRLGLIYTLFFSVLIPLVCLFWLQIKGAISSINIPNREDRVIPYLICATCLTACSIVLSHKNMFGFVYGSFYAGAVTLIICALVNFWWKISVHSAAIGCWIGCATHVWTEWPLCYYAHNNFLVLTTLFLIAGIVLSARIASGQHNESQVYTGFGIGAAIGYGMLFLFWVN